MHASIACHLYEPICRWLPSSSPPPPPPPPRGSPPSHRVRAESARPSPQPTPPPSAAQGCRAPPREMPHEPGHHSATVNDESGVDESSGGNGGNDCGGGRRVHDHGCCGDRGVKCCGGGDGVYGGGGGDVAPRAGCVVYPLAVGVYPLGLLTMSTAASSPSRVNQTTAPTGHWWE